MICKKKKPAGFSLFLTNFLAIFSRCANDKFHLDNLDVNFVRNALKSLKSNKAVGIDKLSARLLKDASDVIAPILTALAQ